MEKITPEFLAEFMHNQYEEIAIQKGWNTQQVTKVSFENLPPSNKDTMLELADRIIKLLIPELFEVSSVACAICSYQWVAVRPDNTNRLECPNCGCLTRFENIK